MKKVFATSTALLLIGTLGLTGCKNAKTEPASSETKKPSVAVSPLPVEPSFKGEWGGYHKDVKLSSCGTDQGTQKAVGTVNNSSDKQLDYAITVMWLNNGDGTPYASSMAVVKAVKPGESKEFTVETNVPTKVDMCWLRVVGGELA